jgi:hypothetical protein
MAGDRAHLDRLLRHDTSLAQLNALGLITDSTT